MLKSRYNFKGISTLSDIRKIEETPLEVQDIPSSTYEAFSETVALNGDQTALTFLMLADRYKEASTYSFSQLHAEVNKLANFLYKIGMEKEDTCAILLPNLPETCVSMLAAQATGIAMPVNPLLEPAQWLELLNAAEAKVLITIAPFLKSRTDIWEKLDTIRPDLKTVEHIILVDMSNHLKGFRKSLVKTILSFKRAPVAVDGQHIYQYERALQGVPSDKLLSKRKIDPDDIACYFHTGGTTGRPKIAMLSHRNICFNAWSAGNNVNTETEGLTILGALPLFHVLGAMVCLNLPLTGGGSIVMVTPKGYRGDGVIKNFWKICDAYKVNYIAAVPAIFKQVLEVDREKGSGNSIRFALCGSAPLPVEVAREFSRETGIEIVEGYGCTEATCICSANPIYGEIRTGSVGFPIPFQEIGIFRVDDLREVTEKCESNESGLVAIRGANVFRGYKEEAHNKNIWIDSGDGKGLWYNTGDLGYFDEDGYLWLSGRKKDLIIRGGHNIDPRMIEEEMYKHPMILKAAAIGRPDPGVGELPVLYVELKAGSRLNESDIHSFAKEMISEKAAIPKRVTILNEMPVTALEKIFKPALQRMEIESVIRQELGDAGLKNFDVEVVSQPPHGQIAWIGVSGLQHEKEISQRLIKERMKPYTFRYELKLK